MAATAIGAAAAGAQPGLRLGSLFSDNLVLQREIAVPVWGTAAPGDAVTVSFAGQRQTARAGGDGRWMLRLEPLAASAKPETLTVSAGNTVPVEVRNVLVGEVWVCSGQSNMEWPVSKSLNADQEVAAANHPAIRLLYGPRTPCDVPLDEMRGGRWAVCSPASVANFSAVAYFFARDVNARTGLPVGLIDSSWGGTDAEVWMSAKALATIPETTKSLNAFRARSAALRAAWRPGINQPPAEQRHGAADNAGFLRGWAATDLPTGDDWQDMELPGTWQQRGLDFSGVLWFRREVALPAAWEGHALRLGIGAVDKDDITYVNHEKVGALCSADDRFSYRTPRWYDIPARLARKGKNVIAVRARSDFFDGGMTGPAETMVLSCPSLPDAPAISLAGTWRYAIESNYGLCSPGLVTSLFNGMIRPLVPFAIRGVLWYQGENNAAQAGLYRKLLPTLIQDWRAHWGQGDFAFYVVQIANYMGPAWFEANSDLARLREAQTVARNLPNAALVVTMDTGEVDCHGKNKQDVGHRLAANALARLYGQKDIPCSGPLFREATVEGGRMRVRFDLPSGPLVTAGGEPVQGFVLAGADGVFHPAKATIDGDSVLVETAEVTAPRAVRYAWANNPICNLRDTAGWPAEPFRTDTGG